MKSYRFLTSADRPVIIDCGSNVGLSLEFFRRMYPKADIYGFEADPEVYQKLRLNLGEDFSSERIHNQAVWIHSDGVNFNSSGDDTGKINDGGSQLVPTIRLKDFIDQFDSVDMLKIDVEGAEYKILDDCKDVLKKVRNIFVEVHQGQHLTGSLAQVVSILENSGFKLVARSENDLREPLMAMNEPKLETQVNLYGYRG